jgi:hypothetical protein
MVCVRVDTKVCAYADSKLTHVGEVRHRWNRSTYGFHAMFDQLYTHRIQLKAVFGRDLFSIVWWKVDDEAGRRGVTSMLSVRMAREMLHDGQLVIPSKIDMTDLITEFGSVNWELFPFNLSY